MAKLASRTARKASNQQFASELGRKLREIAGKISASGERPLTRREIERDVAQRRGGVY